MLESSFEMYLSIIRPFLEAKFYWWEQDSNLHESAFKFRVLSVTPRKLNKVKKIKIVDHDLKEMRFLWWSHIRIHLIQKWIFDYFLFFKILKVPTHSDTNDKLFCQIYTFLLIFDLMLESIALHSKGEINRWNFGFCIVKLDTLQIISSYLESWDCQNHIFH